MLLALARSARPPRVAPRSMAPAAASLPRSWVRFATGSSSLSAFDRASDGPLAVPAEGGATAQTASKLAAYAAYEEEDEDEGGDDTHAISKLFDFDVVREHQLLLSHQPNHRPVQSSLDEPSLRFGLPDADEFLTLHDNSIFMRDQTEAATLLPEGLGGRLTSHLTEIGTHGLLLRASARQLCERVEGRRKSMFLGRHARPLVLSGLPGSGKSATLTTLVYWARQSGWLVFYVPSAQQMVNSSVLRRSRLNPNMYDQPEVFQRMCIDLIAAHGDKLGQLLLKRQIITVPEFERTPKSTLLDLLTVGAENVMYSADVMYFFRKELALVTEYPVLLAIDEVNVLFEPTLNFYDPDFEPRFKPDKLHASKLMTTHMFSNFLNHGLLNGTCVTATSNTCLATTGFDKFLSKNVGCYSPVSQPSYSAHEFRRLFEYYVSCGHVLGEPTRGMQDYIFALTQGRPSDVFKYSTLV